MMVSAETKFLAATEAWLQQPDNERFAQFRLETFAQYCDELEISDAKKLELVAQLSRGMRERRAA